MYRDLRVLESDSRFRADIVTVHDSYLVVRARSDHMPWVHGLDIVNAGLGCYGCRDSTDIADDEYVGAILVAGFQDIRVVDETPFPVDLMANDPTGKAIVENCRMSAEDVREIANSVLSVNLNATKPKKTT